MTKTIEEINNKADYLEYVHYIVRNRGYDIVRRLIEYCKNVDLEEYDLNADYRVSAANKIRGMARASNNCTEIAGLLFEFDTMGDYRIRNKDSLIERVDSLIEGYELGTYKR